MRKQLLSFLLLFLISNFCYSQKQITPNPKYPELFKSIQPISSNSPKWVKLLYSNTPNYYKIEEAFTDYYNENTFKKSIHTQNFKYLSKQLRYNNYLLDDGSIYIPSIAEKAVSDLKLRKQRAAESTKKRRSSDSWIPIGPFETYQGGGVIKKSSQTNIYTIDQSQSNPDVLFSGSETGAVFKTTDKGINWSAVGENTFNDGGINLVKIDPTNENIIYVGAGNKLYKSSNGGTTWITLLNIYQLHLTAMVINPTNSQIIHIVGNNGLRRSTDGGTSWNHVYTDRCWDIQLKTNDPNTLFLSKTNPTKNITEILKSTDNGLTFTVKNTGWYEPIGGVATSNQGARIGVTNADANRIYVILLGEENDAVADNNFIGIYRSDNAAESWTTPYDGNGDGNPDNEPGGPYSADHWCFTHFGVTSTGYDQGFYNLAIDVSDTDANDFMVGSLNLFKSEDGGVTYKQWGGYGCSGCGPGYRHPDIQDIEINGNDVWVCSDGGIDYYDGNLDFVSSRKNGVNGTDFWGFDQGWNDDVLTGGRYHNGNAAHYDAYGIGNFLSLGGGESPTGYVNKGENRKVQHSDINGYEIPLSLTGALKTIPKYALFPNQHYYIEARSEIVNDTRYWNELYLGRENKFWKSKNQGGSFDLVKEFGTNVNDIVKSIEISRVDPNIMFLTQKVGNQGKLWKTIDGGVNWTDVALPANHRTMYISLNTDNELYLALDNQGNNGNKIFKSTDLGTSWQNITTTTLNGFRIGNIQVQEGTNGGVYISANKSIFYKNNTHTDWQQYSANLPLNIGINKIIPFYKKGKLRLAGTRGIWEVDLFETSLPKAQPMVSSKKVNCNRVVVQYEDFSILNHTGASWEWQFPGAATVSSTTVRNPKVTYTTQGDYDVTLKITDANGNTSTKTVSDIIHVGESFCSPEPNPQMALECTNSGDYLTNSSINIPNIANFSFTGWVKPNGIQPDFSAIFSLSDGCALNFREGNNTLGIHWPDGSYWWWDSNLVVPADEWSYIAITVTPTQITLFVNEKSRTWNLTTTPFDLTKINIGTYHGWNSRNYKGLIEEVSFWKKTLTVEEVRLTRHLTKDDVTDPDLIAYYQFNHDNSGTIYDKKGINDLRMTGNATLVTSDAPVGPGTSSITTVNATGVADFTAANSKMTFSSTGTNPNGELVVTKINTNPSALPSTDVIDEGYWVVNNYGTNTTFNGLTDITFSNITNVETLSTSNVQLFKRESNASSSNAWGSSIETATNINAADKSAQFLNSGSLNSFSQFYIGSNSVLSNHDFLTKDFVLYPNPIAKGENLNFHNLKEEAKFSLYDISGKLLFKQIVKPNTNVTIPNLAVGVHLYVIETSTKIKTGKLLIKD